jgi:hypothetical protein
MLFHLLYIDPGSGIGIAQILTAVAGALIIFWARTKMFVTAIFGAVKRKLFRGKDAE